MFFGNDANTRTFIRNKVTSANWSTWQEVSTNIPSFYKNYNSIDNLASALGAFGSYQSTPIDNILSINRTGIFLSTSTTVNKPDNDSNFIVSISLQGVGIILLFAFGNNGQHLYFGVSRNNTVTWRLLQQS